MELLRLLGMWNAAIWFGAAVFYVTLVEPAAYSAQMTAQLGGAHAGYFAGLVSQFFAKRFFALQLVCGIFAVVHLTAEWLYFGRVPRRWARVLLAALIGLNLLSGLALQPRLKKLNLLSHAVNLPTAARESAAGSLTFWRVTSSAVNVLTVLGLGFYFWPRTTSAPTPSRFLAAKEF